MASKAKWRGLLDLQSLPEQCFYKSFENNALLYKQIIKEHLNPYFIKKMKQKCDISTQNNNFVMKFQTTLRNLRLDFEVNLKKVMFGFKDDETEEE